MKTSFEGMAASPRRSLISWVPHPCTVSSSAVCLSLLYHSLWTKPAAGHESHITLWRGPHGEKASSQPQVVCHVILQPQFSSLQRLLPQPVPNYNLLRYLETELPNQAAPKFLPHGNCECSEMIILLSFGVICGHSGYFLPN